MATPIDYVSGNPGDYDYPPLSASMSSMTAISALTSFSQPLSNRSNAILHTACGCERRMDVPNPPPPIVRVPLSSPAVSFAQHPSGPSSSVNVAIREFEFEQSTGSMFRKTHHYRERR
jgi:hypothetical protein